MYILINIKFSDTVKICVGSIENLRKNKIFSNPKPFLKS